MIWKLYRKPPVYQGGKCLSPGEERDLVEWFSPKPFRRIPAADVWRWRAALQGVHIVLSRVS